MPLLSISAGDDQEEWKNAMDINLSEHESKRIIRCALLLILFISCIPLYSRILIMAPSNQDLIFHVSRIEGLTQAMQSGQFPVRIQTYQLNGYGYPVSIMYGDIFLYPCALLGMLGIPATFSYKLLVIAVNAATVYLTYWICRRVFTSYSISLVATLLWTLAPYRLEDVYMRSAVGEYLALTFLPVILYGLYSLFYRDRIGAARQPWIVLSLGVSAVILSHLLSIVLFVIPLIVVYIVGFIKRRKDWAYILRQTCMTVIAVAGLTLWFVWPMLQTYATVPLSVKTRGNKTYPDAPQVFQLFELFAPMDGGSVADTSQYAQFMPTAIGWGIFLISLVFIAVRLLDHTRSGDEAVISGIGISLGIVAIGVMILSSNLFPWAGTPLKPVQKIIGKLRVIQFSWRFIGVATVLLIVVGCCGCYLLRRNTKINKLFVPCIAVICVFGLLEGCFAISSFIRHSVPAEEPYSQHQSEIGTGEYLITGTDLGKTKINHPRTYKAVVTGFTKDGTTMSFRLNAKKNSWVELPAFNYPNYRISTSPSKGGLHLEDGRNHVIRIKADTSFVGHVYVYYREPVSWRVSEAISVLSLAAIGVYSSSVLRKKSQRMPHESRLTDE